MLNAYKTPPGAASLTGSMKILSGVGIAQYADGGPPGSGISMLAQHFAGLLQPMDVDEALESTTVADLAGSAAVQVAHVAEAVQYRRVLRGE